MTRIRTAIGSHVLVAALAVVGALGLSQLASWDALEAAPAAGRDLTPASPESFADVIEAVQPAVVNIASDASRGPELQRPRFEMPMPRDRSLEEFFRRFFERQAYRSADDYGRPRAMGSGFVIDPDGLIVTNDHVVQEGADIVVTMNDGSRYDAEVVGHDAKTDLALLKVDADDPLPYVSSRSATPTRLAWATG